MNFKVGDRVKVYDICQVTKNPTEDTGIVLTTFATTENLLQVKMDTWGSPPKNIFFFHKKQCRKLVKKTIKYPKKLSKDFGFGNGITRERYRQMKLKLKRRWEQINELEKDLSNCATEIGHVIELAKRQDQTKDNVRGWLEYIYEYWKKYE